MFKKFKLSKKYYIAMIIIGGIIFISGIVFGILNKFARFAGFTNGGGAAWITMGVIGLNNIRKNPNFIKEYEINNNDERLIHIKEKSALIAFVISIFAEITAMIIFLIIKNYAVCVVMIVVVLIQFISWIVSMAVLDRKM